MWRRALRPRPLSLRRQLLRERERESERRDSVVEQRRGAHLCHRDACAHVDIRSIRRFARRRVRGGCRVFAPGRGHRAVRSRHTAQWRARSRGRPRALCRVRRLGCRWELTTASYVFSAVRCPPPRPRKHMIRGACVARTCARGAAVGSRMSGAGVRRGLSSSADRLKVPDKRSSARPHKTTHEGNGRNCTHECGLSASDRGIRARLSSAGPLVFLRAACARVGLCCPAGASPPQLTMPTLIHHTPAFM
jgi:hypothetical protein